MSKTFCFDSAILGKATLTDEGYLKAPVVLSKVGVANYGYAKKAKTKDELLSTPTVDSFKGIPVTDEHPMVDGRYVYVTSENSQKFARGNVSEPYVEGDSVKAMITIWDKQLVQDVLDGKRDVSLAYQREDKNIPGDIDGETYDIIQTNIIGNHLAVTTHGRISGSVIEIDSDGQIKGKNKETIMPTFKKVENGKIIEGDLKTFRTSKGTDITVDSDLHIELVNGRKIGEDKQIEVDTLTTEVEKLKKEKTPETDSTIKAKIETLELDSKVKADTITALENKIKTQKTDFDSQVDKAAEERLKVIESAKALDIDTKDKSVLALKKEIIGKSIEVDIDTLKTDIEIDAYYNASMKVKKELAISGPGSNNSNIDTDSASIKKTRDEEMDKLINGDK